MGRSGVRWVGRKVAINFDNFFCAFFRQLKPFNSALNIDLSVQPLLFSAISTSHFTQAHPLYPSKLYLIFKNQRSSFVSLTTIRALTLRSKELNCCCCYT